jgi:hypothetical protein
MDYEVFEMRKLAIIALAVMTCLGSIAPASAFDVRYPRGKAVDGLTGLPNTPTDSRADRCGRYRNCNGGRDRYRYNNSDRYRYEDRRDYRRHDDTGAIIGGLAAGAIIGGVIASQQGASSGNSHVDSCYSRYRSYRASDNTYQPNYGPRRQCVGR